MNLLDMLINKTVEIEIEKGIIQSKAIIVDATHTKARYNQKSPREILLKKWEKVLPLWIETRRRPFWLKLS